MATILVAEDDADVRFLIDFVLSKAGHEVVAVENGRAALGKTTEPRPHLIISDIMMPELDGYSVAASLSADASTASIPVLIMSSKTSMRDACQALPNVKGFISKPFDPVTLVEFVRAVLDSEN